MRRHAAVPSSAGRGSPASAVPALPAETLPTATLVWDGGQLPACERSELLRKNVSVYLGRDPFEDGAPLTIRIGVRRAPDAETLIADVSEVDDQGHSLGVRSVHGGESCETLDEPLTLVVALMLDEPLAVPERQLEVAPRPPQAPEQPAKPTADDAEDSDTVSNVSGSEAEETPPAHAFVSAGIGTSFGKLPFLNYGPQLQVVWKPRRFWGLELSGGALFGSRADLPGSGTIDFRLLELGGALCPLESLRDGILLRGCAGVAVGWLRAESHGLEPPHSRTEVVFSPEAHLQIAKNVGEILLFGGGVEVAFPIRPNQYVYRDAEGVRQQAFQMAIPSLSLELFVAGRLH